MYTKQCDTYQQILISLDTETEYKTLLNILDLSEMGINAHPIQKNETTQKFITKLRTNLESYWRYTP